jgi:hypothetical protein
MPYETYTNDSDAQFAAELDKFKLGPGVTPGGSAFAASEAMMDSMGNDYKNVAALMQARASLAAASMGTRKSISEDVMNKQASDDFDSYSKMMELGVTGDPLEDAKLRKRAALQFGDNERVNRHLSAFAAADAGVIQGRKAISENRQLDYEDETWDERKDLDRQMLSMNKQKNDFEITRQNDLMTATNENVGTLVYGSAGAMIDKNSALASSITKTAYHLRDDLEMSKALGKASSVMSQTYGLESVYAERHKKNAPAMAAISQKVGMNADDIDDPAMYDVFLAKAKAVIESGPENEKEGALAALENHASMKGIFLQRSALEKDFNSHLDKRPANLSSPEGEEWKAGLVALREKATFIGGHIAKKQEELNDQLSKQDAYTKAALQIQQMRKNDAEMKNSASRIMLAERAHEWNVEKFSRTEKLRLLQMAMPDKKKAELEVELELLKSEFEEMELNFSSGNGSLID